MYRLIPDETAFEGKLLRIVVDGATDFQVLKVAFHHSAEIVTILPGALGLLGPKHKFPWFSVPQVFGQKSFETVAHIDCSIFLVLQSLKSIGCKVS
jgi:hypothetical protein